MAPRSRLLVVGSRGVRVPATVTSIGSLAFPRDNAPNCPALAAEVPSRCTDATTTLMVAGGGTSTYARFMQINCPLSCYNHEQEVARNRYVSFTGYWKLASRETRTRTISQAVCRDRSSSNSFARAVSTALTTTETVTSSAGFGDFGGVEASLEVSHSRGTNTEWARDVTRGVESCNEVADEVTCDHGTRCDADQFAYQFGTRGVRASGQEDTVESCAHVVCVAGDTPLPRTPKCPYEYCDKLSGCQCCLSDEWAAPAERARVPVCVAQCASGPGTPVTQCHQFVAQQGACHGANGDFTACLARQCGGCIA
jgi:hypothetical protein